MEYLEAAFRQESSDKKSLIRHSGKEYCPIRLSVKKSNASNGFPLRNVTSLVIIKLHKHIPPNVSLSVNSISGRKFKFQITTDTSKR